MDNDILDETNNGDLAIELNNVSYQYPTSSEMSLSGVSFDVQKGKFTAIMGATGAGKTTLCLCLNGLIPQLLEGKLTGSLKVGGMEVRKTPVQLMAKVLGLVLQDPETQLFGRTVEEDTAFGPRNLAVAQADVQQRVDNSLEKVNLKGYNQRLTEELSGGEKQRLAIAGVLAMEPEILVLDEPTSELDPSGRVTIYNTLDALHTNRDLTVLLVEHSAEELIDKADEIIVLQQGKIAWRGEPRRLFRNIPLLRQYGLKPIPVSLIGWNCFAKGLITEERIPLDLESAEALFRELLSEKEHDLTGAEFGNDQACFTQVRPEIPTPNGLTSRELVLGKLDLGELAIRELAIGELALEKSTTEKLTTEGLAQKEILKISDLYYNYESGQPALQGINLTINRGEFVALVGQNGAGKTTLAKHLNGLLKPSGGDVSVCGMNTKDYGTAHLAKTIGYVFQNPDHQIFSSTVEKELEYGLRNAGIKGAEAKARINRVLEATGLGPYRSVHPFTLGKGERQIIAVASILVLKPQILIIDEPTTGSDWTGVQAMMRLSDELHRAGTTIIMISHDMDLVARHAQHVIVLKEGRVLLDGSPREVFAKEKELLAAAIIPPMLCRLSLRLRDSGFDLGLNEVLLRPEEFTALLESEEAKEAKQC